MSELIWFVKKNDKLQNILPIQNVRQYSFRDMAKYEKKFAKGKYKINIEEFRPK